ncbi:MAG: bifunctional phosphoglucose/phosphomannose isomerase, partial [Dehalococcoidia bacterium]
MDKVVILGMGGSAIGGDLLSNLVADESRAFVSVHRGYDLPSFVDSSTLVIASSYSGMTEETLSSFRQALSGSAKKLVISTGGELKKLAEQNSIPVFTINYVSQPRAALAHSLMPLLGICQNLGLVGDKSQDVQEMVQVLENIQSSVDDECPTNRNPAKQMPTRLNDRVAVIYGADILSTVAQRWKTQ